MVFCKTFEVNILYTISILWKLAKWEPSPSIACVLVNHTFNSYIILHCILHNSNTPNIVMYDRFTDSKFNSQRYTFYKTCY